MKAKKPLLLVVFTLALLAVALILPAAAFGKPDLNKPVNWASSSENSNQTYRDVGWQGGHSYLAKELSGGSVVGHVTLQTMKSGDMGRVRLSTTQLTFDDPLGVDPRGGFDKDAAGNPFVIFYALFDMVDDLGNPFVLPMKFILVDGGEPPKGLDKQAIYWPGETGWELFGIEPGFSEAVGNIQIHLGSI